MHELNTERYDDDDNRGNRIDRVIGRSSPYVNPIKPKSIQTTESKEQVALVNWLNIKKILFYHIPNGGFRNGREAVNLKRVGVKAGVPDLCIPISKKSFHGLYIELKRDKSSHVSDSQKWWIAELRKNGYDAVICCGADEAIKYISEYLK